MTVKKRLLSIFLVLTFICSSVPCVFAENAENDVWKSFYVSVLGSDEGDGSESSPFATLARAQEEVRKYNKDMQGDIVVNIMGGRYELSNEERWEFHIEDSGSKGYDIIYRAADKNNIPTISGAVEVKGTWTKGENGIWHIKADNLEFAREMFVNDKTTVRARSPKVIWGDEYYKDENDNALGMYIDKAKLGLYENPEDVEFHWVHFWKDSFYYVEDILQDPDNPNRVIAILERDVWKSLVSMGFGTQEAGIETGFTVENAYELLDEPGEFYFNKKTKVLSYIPREGEDMNTAEVLVPKSDQLLYIRGDNYYNRVKNLRFENIRFAHTTNSAFEFTSYGGGQGEYPYPSNLNGRQGRAANSVDWAENIDFEQCVFYGLTAMGLHFRHGVHHSNVNGCVFTDLGASGFAAGHVNEITMTEPVDKNGAADVAWRAGWESSSIWHPTVSGSPNVQTFYGLNTQRNAEADFGYVGSGWYSQPWEKEEGRCPWIKLDLEDDYSLDTFRFSFPNNATDEDRSNIEILVSNDKKFEEYKVIKTYTTPADFMNEIKVEDEGKYRYIMLRKTAPESFSLNGVWAISSDAKQKGEMGAPADCNITNNVITRIGEQLPSSIGIWLNYTKRFNVLHNYIYEVPYSGVSVGWGWANNNATTSGENKVNYNRIDEYMCYSEDGGGIYTFGKQWGTEFRGNYISNGMTECHGIYLDQGTDGVSVIDNISLTTNGAYQINGEANQNVIKNLWTDRGVFYDNDTQTDNIKENPKYFALSDPPEEVARIIGDAGLEDEWKWIEERVPDNKTKILKGPESFESSWRKKVQGMSAPSMANDINNHSDAILQDGTFGDLPWQFDSELKDDFEYWIEAFKTNGNRSDDYSKGHMEEFLNVKELVIELNRSVYHPTWEEMLKMCDELAESAKATGTWGGFPQAAITKFKKDLEETRKLTPGTRADKAAAALKLEKIYTELWQQRYTADIISASLDNGTVDIDRENKKLTVNMTDGADTVNILPEITTSAGSKVAVDLATMDYSSGKVKIPVYQPEINKYAFWDMEIKSTEVTGDRTVVSAKAEDWIGGNINSSFVNYSDFLNIIPWYSVSMNTKPMASKFSFNLWAPRGDATNGIGIIFCAQTDDLQPTTKELKNSYYMAALKGQDMTLYRVKSGVKEEIITARSIVFKYDEYNPFEISVVPEGEMDRVIIKSEGATIIDTLVNDPIGQKGYFGIWTQDMAVRIK